MKSIKRIIHSVVLIAMLTSASFLFASVGKYVIANLPCAYNMSTGLSCGENNEGVITFATPYIPRCMKLSPGSKRCIDIGDEIDCQYKCTISPFGTPIELGPFWFKVKAQDVTDED
ncbi:MAG: hypothetical protein IKQ24_01035 [Verrucomicrobia bacterium]|nr:hypothetical protein [Verrucomicrobiota bacterium]